MRRLSALVVLSLCLFVVGGATVVRAGDGPVVQAVLFYSQNCGHCHYVMTEVLPPLQDQYGHQLVIEEVDVSTPDGQAQYQAAVVEHGIPPERMGVPTMIVGDVVLVGSLEIPEKLPGLIEARLAGPEEPLGTDTPPTPAVEPTPPPPLTSGPSASSQDPLARGLAIAVLIGMVFSLGYVAFDGYRVLRRQPRLTRGRKRKVRRNEKQVEHSREWTWQEGAFVALALLGLIVATYLTVVEVTDVQPLCGPVGDCEEVHRSDYAWLFGLFPVAGVGLLGYLSIVAVWAWGWLDGDLAARWASALLLGMTLVGTLFSTYLTFLEPFVIEATCAWCLVSAVCMTLLLLLVAGRGWRAVRRLVG